MSAVYLVPIDLSNLEIRNVLAQLLGSDPTGVEGKFFYHTGDKTIHFYNGTTWIILGRLDQISAPTASVSLNSQKITSLADGTSAGDAVNKGQLDAAVAGIKWKASVRAATTVNGTLATAFENGDVIDGVTLATGDRILLKNQTAGAENGIYVVAASGAPTRATDADTAAEILQSAVFVQEGTANADSGWVLSTNAPITLNTTALVFAQFTGGTMTAGNGLDLTGSTLSVNVANGIEIAADAVQIENGGVLTVTHGGTGRATLTDHGVVVGRGTAAADITAAGATGTILRGKGAAANPAFEALDLATDVGSSVLPIANGGTNAASAAAAAATLGFMRRFAASVGDTSATSFNIDHNFGTLDVIVQVYRNSDGVEVVADVSRTTTNRVVVAFAVAPTTNQYRVVVVG